eukprot:TRINITY_DN65560_c0_g1_i4.p1 TRINITY_DN65560_c0_g1~~TRINITY_DN65560_c0_g1_i4.p1  ORF type:complete len:291 (-),score=32.57 TRINITY_DN65560_c0_g1_i4:68-940(-)
MLCDKLQVGEISDEQVVAVKPVAPLRMIVDILRGCRHGAIPVTPNTSYVVGKPAVAEKEFELQGVVQRGQLLKILKHRLGFFYPEEVGILPPPDKFLPKSTRQLRKVLEKLEEIPMRIHLSEQESVLSTFSDKDMDEYYVDLRPYMRRYPYVLRGDAPVSRAYRLFRTMGLRQIFVTTTPKATAIITRKDLSNDNLMLILGKKARAGSIKITRRQKRCFERQRSNLVPVIRFDHKEEEQNSMCQLGQNNKEESNNQSEADSQSFLLVNEQTQLSPDQSNYIIQGIIQAYH